MKFTIEGCVFLNRFGTLDHLDGLLASLGHVAVDPGLHYSEMQRCRGSLCIFVCLA
jgi:hypothetical protein